ncbi:MAG: hypothetical protein WB586_29800 [Chthoniobacterales bacterium]
MANALGAVAAKKEGMWGHPNCEKAHSVLKPNKSLPIMEIIDNTVPASPVPPPTATPRSKRSVSPDKIRSRQWAVDNVLDWAEIEALIREAIALLEESGELIPRTRSLDPDCARALCTEQQPTTRPDDRGSTLNT